MDAAGRSNTWGKSGTSRGRKADASAAHSHPQPDRAATSGRTSHGGTARRSGWRAVAALAVLARLAGGMHRAPLGPPRQHMIPALPGERTSGMPGGMRGMHRAPLSTPRGACALAGIGCAHAL